MELREAQGAFNFRLATKVFKDRDVKVSPDCSQLLKVMGQHTVGARKPDKDTVYTAVDGAFQELEAHGLEEGIPILLSEPPELRLTLSAGLWEVRATLVAYVTEDWKR